MGDISSTILNLVARTAAEAAPALPAGSMERKNLLILQRLAVKALADQGVTRESFHGAGASLAEARPRIERALSAAGKALPVEWPAGEMSPGEVADALSRAAQLLGEVDSAEARELFWQCIDLEAGINRRGEDFYQSRMAEYSSAGAGGAAVTIDLDRLAGFLSEQAGEPVTIRSARNVPGGFSKLTVIVELEKAGPYPPRIVVRLDRKGGYLNTTVADEFEVISALHKEGVAVPRPLASDPTGAVLGDPFIVVEARPGRTIGDMFNPPEPSAATNESVAAALAGLHSVPLDRMGDALRGTELSTREQAADWLMESKTAWQGLATPSAIMDAGFAWLEDNLHLAEGVPVVMHGDLGLNNMLIEDERLTALLDWEFVRAGHAGYDLGYFHCMAVPLGSWEDFLVAYGRAGGVVPAPEVLDFFILFANVRLATMVWQGATAFGRGQLTDLVWANPGANDQRVATMRVAEQLRKVAG